MDTVYITQENSTLARAEEHLILKKQGRSVATIPVAELKTIVITCSVQITSFALELLFDNGIDVIYATRGGKIKGRIDSAKGGGAIVRLAQHSAFLDGEFRLSIAREIVRAKIHNQLRVIQKHSKHNFTAEIKDNIEKISAHSAKLDAVQTADEIMGTEGISAKVYWECFRQMLNENISPLFCKRDYRPAPDIVNSALNLGYAFLANEITAALSVNKFDIEIGFLHSIHYGRNSLVLDIMEEFRAPFIDNWILTMFNRRFLKAELFKGREDGYFLSDDGFHKFCASYADRVNDGKWRKFFRQQSEELKSAITTKQPYRGFRYE